MDAIARAHRATAVPLAAVLAEAARAMDARKAHPARTIVLLPFLQLVADARTWWARERPDGFAPAFETSRSWAAQRGFAAGPDDFAGDAARDLPAARSWVAQAGLAAQADVLAPQVVAAAGPLADVAASIPPAARAAWASRAGQAIAFEGSVFALEQAIGRIALAWTSASAYPGDALLEGDAPADLVIVVRGIREEPFAEALLARWGDRAMALDLRPSAAGILACHPARDPADEAERAAACVLAHVQAGRTPVALVAHDRVLTRRVRAMLESRGAALADETGWTLSTTRAASRLMALLRACSWNASTDAVLDAMKNAPAVPGLRVQALERFLRREGVREWRGLSAGRFGDKAAAALAAFEQAQAWRAAMAGRRGLREWIVALRELLDLAGLWRPLAADAAGAKVIESLRLESPPEARNPHARQSLSLAEFSSWVSAVLEDRNFMPAPSPDPDVVILPPHLMLGRAFAAAVVAGCDERTLESSPEPAGPWSAAQRELLGLPSRDDLARAQQAAWACALQAPATDILWREGDENGEPLLPSPFVQALRLAGGAEEGTDARRDRDVASQPVARPDGAGNRLPIPVISASAYEDLRRCPYRFFALRQLGLHEAEELDTEVDKRDFGNWLHAVLRRFHEDLQARRDLEGDARRPLLDEAAAAVTRDMALDEGEFLPFQAAWPKVRDGYFDWLRQWERTEGARFAEAERDVRQDIGELHLMGRIDRIDSLGDGRLIVMDYKTEGLQRTKDRVAQPVEDTQLAFYAALLGGDHVRAAYVNVNEREGTKLVEQPHVIEARDALLEGLRHDLDRIAHGEPMPALGEGHACEFCAARGLCRRDWWA